MRPPAGRALTADPQAPIPTSDRNATHFGAGSDCWNGQYSGREGGTGVEDPYVQSEVTRGPRLGPDNPSPALIAAAVSVPLHSNAAGILPLVDARYANGMPMGTPLAFMLATLTLLASDIEDI